jgi:hypothetical protein
VGSLRGGRWGRQRVRIGTPDPTLTPVSGMLAVSELVERLDVVGRLDAAIGPIKQRRTGRAARSGADRADPAARRRRLLRRAGNQ